jgi:hypothetical protein
MGNCPPLPPLVPLSSAGEFSTAYSLLEARMRLLAELEGDVFLPNPEPKGPVHYVLIGMEPSLGRWARSAAQAKAKVDAGFRNFLSSMEDFILHFCAQRYLCREDQRYLITDLSKGAMLVRNAEVARAQRYDRWYSLLLDEIAICGTPNARFIAVGKVVQQQLLRRGFGRPLVRVIHYSSQAAPARRAEIVGHEASFEAFIGTVSLEELVSTAAHTMEATGLPSHICAEVLARLRQGRLTLSRQQLIFHYKQKFEAIRAA